MITVVGNGGPPMAEPAGPVTVVVLGAVVLVVIDSLV